MTFSAKFTPLEFSGMPIPKKPNDNWINARIRLSPEHQERLNALCVVERGTMTKVVQKAIEAACAKVTPSQLKAYRTIAGVRKAPKAEKAAKASKPPKTAKKARKAPPAPSEATSDATATS